MKIEVEPELYRALSTGAEYYSAPIGSLPEEEITAQFCCTGRSFEAILIPFSRDDHDVYFALR